MTPLEKLTKHLNGQPALICLQAMDCMPEEMTRPALEIQDGVAIIQVRGVLGNGDCCTTTYGQIQGDLAAAMADTAVRGILLDINSPGGSVDGLFETGAAIAAAGKPVWAVASPMAYSAAYWLASQASRIYVPQVSGGVGSIGVYCAHQDVSGFLAKMGVAITLFFAGKGKVDGNPYEPLTADAKNKIQADIDRLYGEFVNAVSAGRGMKIGDIIALGAELCDGSKRAIGSGLADRTGDVATAWVDLLSSLGAPDASQFQNKGNDSMKTEQEIQAEALAAANTAAELAATELAASTQAAAEVAAAALAASELAAATQLATDEMIATATAAGYSAAAEIVELCAVAGKPGLASVFVAQKFTRAQASEEILKQRSVDSGVEITSNIHADASTGTEVLPGQSAIVKLCEARALAAAKR